MNSNIDYTPVNHVIEHDSVCNYLNGNKLTPYRK